MMKFKATAIVMATAIGVLATPAMAGNAAKNWFNKVDANNNGTIELAEYRKHRNGVYAGMDRDNDKFLSAGEFMGKLAGYNGPHAKNLKARRAKSFQQIDGNNDKKIGPLEWAADTERKFKMTDADKNKKITPQEIERAFNKKISLD